jgi:calcium-dependent protein kinase
MGCTIAIKSRKPIEENFISRPNEIKIDPGLFIQENKKKFKEVYKMSQSLGKSIYGEVRICILRENGQKRAVKIFRKSSMSYNYEKSQLDNQISILKSLDHPNIIRIFEFFDEAEKYYLVMEYCSGGNLFSKILKRQFFSENDSAKIFYQISSAIFYLHSRGIIHGNLNPENILLEEKSNDIMLNIKLVDFGSAIFEYQKKEIDFFFGKPYYTAPEVYERVFNEKIDIWNCGVILYILLCGYPPFDGENDEQIITLAKRGEPVMTGGIWDKISSTAKNLIENLICPSSKRLSASEIIKHPWFKENLHPSISQKLIDEAMENIKNFKAPNKFKDAVMTLLISQFKSPKETKILKETFMAIDKDGDGKISKKELMEQLIENMTIQEAKSEVDRIMSEIDSDNNGFIDYTEFLKVNIDFDKLVCEQNLKLAFSLFDSDGNGKISPEEIKKIFSVDSQADENVWKEIIKSIDANGDGEIDLEEFKSM